MALPRGARAWPQNEDNGVTGVMDLKQLLVRFADPSDRQQVTSEEQDRGFRYAVRRNWTAKDGSQADVYLLRFAAATGAQSFTLGYQGSAADTVGASGTFTVPHSGDAKGYEHSKLTSDGFRWTGTYAVVGNIALDTDFRVPAKTHRADVIAPARKQYAKLMADPTLAAAAAAAPALPAADS